MKSPWKCMQRFLGLLALAMSLNAAGRDTELKLFHPFISGEEPSVRIIQVEKGSCEEPSRRLLRETAYRCQAAGKILDPCFVHPLGTKTRFICPKSPWSGTGTAIQAEQPVLYSTRAVLDMSKSYPWAVELSDGEKCQVLSDGLFFENQPVHYHCTGKSFLFGHLQRCKPAWSILKRNADAQVETTEIHVAWF